MNPKKIGQLIIIALVLTAGYFFYAQVFGATTIGKTLITAGSLQTGLVGHWTFDGKDMSGTTVTDIGSGGNDGTLTGNPTITRGKLGQALNFDGTGGSVNIPDDPVLDMGTGDFTLSAWVNTSSTTNQYIFNKYQSSAGYLFRVNATTGYIALWVGDGTNILSYKAGSVNVADGQWHHVIARFTKGSLIEFFEDGVLDPTSYDASSVTGSLDNAGSMVLGTFSSNYFDGSLDDARVYNRALSTDEITQLYNNTKGNIANKTKTTAGSLQTGLVGHWTFDGPKLSATTATDSSGQGNNGTLTNGPAPVEGKIGQALDFDGVNDYVTTSGAVMSGNKTSYGGWFNARSLNCANGYCLIAQQADSSDRGFEMYTTNLTKKISCYTYDGLSSSSEIFGPVIETNRWYHVMCTQDGTTSKLYIDGNLYGTYSSSVSVTNSNFLIGAGATGAAYFFKGKMDDVRAYNRALTANEISQLYDSTKGSKVNKTPAPASSLTTGLVGHWTFDGPDMLQNVADVSGQGNTGYLTNFTSTTTTEGKLGQALDFDGVNNYVDAVNDASLEMGTGDMAVSAWVKVKPVQLDTKSGIINKGATINTDEGYGFSYDFGNDRLIFWISDGTTRIWPKSSDSLNLNDDEWHFVVANADRDANVTFYLDGVSVGSSDTSSFNGVDITNSGRNVSIGRWSNNVYYLNGSIDDPRVYNRLLTADEITQLYNLGR